MRYLGASILGAAILALAACGTPRRHGDDGGIPVTFAVHAERAFFSTMSNRQWRPSVGAGAGFSSGGGRSAGLGLGVGFTSTSIFIIGGDGVGQAGVFRKEVKWGDNSFTVPLNPGRTLHVAVQAEGGRVGWEALGTVTVPAVAQGSAAVVRIILDDKGGRLAVDPPTGQPADVPASAPSTAGADSPTTR